MKESGIATSRVKFRARSYRFYFAMALTALFGVTYISCGFAATYYVDGSANNDSGDGSTNNPKKYITSGILLLSSGDTLVIKDGTYSGNNNFIGDYASPRVYPPSGTASAYTVVKAEHVGGVIIDSGYTGAAYSNINNNAIDYLQIEGIHFRHGRCGVFALKGNYNKVLRSGFEDGLAPDNDSECPIASISGVSSYSLMEDVWAWGKGRYAIYTSSTGDGSSYGTNNVIFRRVVVRLDYAPYNWVTCGIQFYDGNDNVCQNCMVIDSIPDTSQTKIWGSFCTTSRFGGASNNSYIGSVALNNGQYSGVFTEATTGTTRFENMSLWDHGSHGLGSTQSAHGEFQIDHVTAGNNGRSGFRSNTAYSLTTNLSNSIAYGNTDYGIEAITSVDTVSLFANGSECYGCGSNFTKITTNPFTTSTDFSAPALKYPIRIEPGSDLSGAATDGGDIGATIVYKIGASGSLKGEPGWNQTSEESLWPWPDEDIWLPKLRAYSTNGPGGDRGFAASGQTLTNYVWGYFNYDADEATPGVTVPPFNVSATTSNNAVILQWNAPADAALATITGFRIYDVTGMSDPVIPGSLTPIASVSGNHTYSATISGLSNGKVYDFAVTTDDSTTGESGYSYIVSATPQSGGGSTTPVITTPSNGFHINLNTRNHFVFSGTAAANLNVEVFIEGNISLGTTTADSNGNWSLSLNLSNLATAEGSVAITAVSDGATSEAVYGIYDITPPAVPTGLAAN